MQGKQQLLPQLQCTLQTTTLLQQGGNVGYTTFEPTKVVQGCPVVHLHYCRVPHVCTKSIIFGYHTWYHTIYIKYRYRISIRIFRPLQYRYRISIGIVGPVQYQYCIGIEISVVDGISIVSVSKKVVSKGSGLRPSVQVKISRPGRDQKFIPPEF